jgi:hypothetical protein
VNYDNSGPITYPKLHLLLSAVYGVGTKEWRSIAIMKLQKRLKYNTTLFTQPYL